MTAAGWYELCGRLTRERDEALHRIVRLCEALEKIILVDKRHEVNVTSQDTGYDGPSAQIARAALREVSNDTAK
jgi:hypothetical protein